MTIETTGNGDAPAPGLKTVVEVSAYKPVALPKPDQKPAVSHNAQRKSA